jgi:hypothetical protein
MHLGQILARFALRRRRSGYFSRFGGLWTDRVDAERLLEAKLAAGAVSRDEAAQLRGWMADGYVVLPGAVSPELADEINGEIERAWAERDPRFLIELGGTYHRLEPALRAERAKLIDLYVFSRAAREAVFAPKIRRFLELVFEREILLFQSLSFERGSGQAVHQDTAYVVTSSPLEFAASWIALEDIRPGSGELCYYRGSHRLEEVLFSRGTRNWNRERDGEAANERYLAGLRERSRASGLELEVFRPKKGDALIWSADLAHGGAEIRDPALTRKSLVSHYCPADVRPYYFSYQRERRAIREHASGLSYSSSHYTLD